MARRNLIEILINSKDNASRGIQNVIATLGNLGNAFVGLQAVQGVITNLAREAIDFAKGAASFENIEMAFRNIADASGQSADSILRDFQRMSGGMVSQEDAMKNYNLAASLIGTNFANQLPAAMGTLSKVAAATGESMDYMMGSLIRGVGRLSPAILDNLGIQVNLTEAYEEWADANERTVDGMSKSEQQAAVMAKVVELLGVNTANIPDVADSAAGALARFNAQVENAKITLGKAFLPVIAPVAELLNDVMTPAVNWIAEILGSKLTPVLVKAAEWVNIFTNQIADGGTPLDGIGALLYSLNNLFGEQYPIIGKVSKAFGHFEDILKVSGKPLQAIRAGLYSLVRGTPIEPYFLSITRIMQSLFQAFYKAGQIIGPALVDAWGQMKGPLGTMFSALTGLGGEGAIGFADIIQNVLAPAIVSVATWIAEKAVPAITDLVIWIAEKVPPAIAEAKRWFQEEFLPAVQNAFTWVKENVIPVAEQLRDVLIEKVVPAVGDLVTIIRDDILGTMQTWKERGDTVIDAMTKVGEYLAEKLSPIVEEAARIWGEILFPALQDIWQFIDTTLMPVVEAFRDVFVAIGELAFRAIAAIWENHLKPALDELWVLLKDKLGLEGDKFALVWERIKDAMEGLKEPLSKVVTKLGELASGIRNVELPDWMMGHSPSPWQVWLEGVAGAMGELSNNAIPGVDSALRGMKAPDLGTPRLGMPALATAAAGAAGAAATTNNNLQITVLADNGKQMFDEIETEAQRRGLKFTEVG